MEKDNVESTSSITETNSPRFVSQFTRQGVSFALLAIIIIAFSVGVLSVLLYINATKQEQITFTTIEL